ncbi:HupE/UreJ family protein [candidate division KSB1 bacterium]|nr:MAG: HupE/UreJ family protein [candidate division KSB1 bacterium]MBC6947690.1 HupE/UreJ family protein [candidate division KSB1 bacterium]MCE7945311.1 HupE/UreJ family protein [Chlorobi bacterium CHB1]MDL1875683.1 HupE/UreJ family protein [Cytophagia bacterium CHB2]
MSEFQTYLTLGFEHISDLGAYDHLLFIVALCAVYSWQQWRTLAILVTAFTLGHSLSLAASVIGRPLLPAPLVEFLIPLTIFATSVLNVVRNSDSHHSANLRWRYLLVLGFGLIHGMGFSNYLRALLGREASIWAPLLAFNLGLEIGQLLIVGVVLGFSWLALRVLKIMPRAWNLFISGAAAGVSLILLTQR